MTRKRLGIALLLAHFFDKRLENFPFVIRDFERGFEALFHAGTELLGAGTVLGGGDDSGSHQREGRQENMRFDFHDVVIGLLRCNIPGHDVPFPVRRAKGTAVSCG